MQQRRPGGRTAWTRSQIHAAKLIEHAIPKAAPVRPLTGKVRTSRRRGAQPAVGSAK